MFSFLFFANLCVQLGGVNWAVSHGINPKADAESKKVWGEFVGESSDVAWMSIAIDVSVRMVSTTALTAGQMGRDTPNTDSKPVKMRVATVTLTANTTADHAEYAHYSKILNNHMPGPSFEFIDLLENAMEWCGFS